MKNKKDKLYTYTTQSSFVARKEEKENEWFRANIAMKTKGQDTVHVGSKKDLLFAYPDDISKKTFKNYTTISNRKEKKLFSDFIKKYGKNK